MSGALFVYLRGNTTARFRPLPLGAKHLAGLFRPTQNCPCCAIALVCLDNRRRNSKGIKPTKGKFCASRSRAASVCVSVGVRRAFPLPLCVRKVSALIPAKTLFLCRVRFAPPLQKKPIRKTQALRACFCLLQNPYFV